MKRLSKIYQVLLMFLPVVLYFSYFPVITLGKDESMNFELSLPLIYLVVFDIVAMVMLGMRRKLVLIIKKWVYLLFPIFASLSILWSSNVLRGVLTAGIMWALYLAIFSTVVLKDEIDEKWRKKMLKVFLWASLLVCLWCLVQCIMDALGVPREYSLMCEGCTSLMFGFPHPNGFAIEPQFMGNLLLAPTIVFGYLMLKRKKYCLPFIVFTATLFLTLSRGAIYAFGVAMLFMTAFYLVITKRKGGEKMWKKTLILWTTLLFSFVVTLNVQGVLAEIGPTNDTYQKAVMKVLNHLSLGIVPNASATVEPVFDGYVVESTEIRKEMSDNALTVWKSSFKNIMFGVGLGGAGRAMQEAGLIDNANEIVQNQYVSLLLEIGIVGVGLLVVLIVCVLKLVVKVPVNALLLTLFVAYGISLCFFAGLPNALHIYLMPAWILVVFSEKTIAFSKKVL